MSYSVLTSHAPRGKMTKALIDKVRPKVARGELPVLPEFYQNTTDPALVAVREAMYKCLQPKPEDRPTAMDIVDELVQAVENLPEGFGDKEKYYASREGKKSGGDDSKNESQEKKGTEGRIRN